MDLPVRQSPIRAANRLRVRKERRRATSRNTVAFAGAELDTAAVAGASQSLHLSSLDYSVVQQCMHCGLCLPTCPTYDATKLERHSPRGRIALMRAIADGQLEATEIFSREMYYCLGCLACMTACPAGVNYAELLEHARAEAEDSRVVSSWRRTLLRSFLLRWVFSDLRNLQLLGSALRLYQQLGFQRLIRRTGLTQWLPRRMRQLERLTPELSPHLSADLIAPVTPARSVRRYRVALLTGCVQDLMFSEINRDTVDVLAENGCEVVTPPEQGCCGSLHVHCGEWKQAQSLARQQLDQFPPDEFDAIISNAGGCGSHLKNYGSLLGDDARYGFRAKLWDEKVQDVHEWLVKIGFRAPQSNGTRFRSSRVKTAYHESCHLSHGQKISAQPRQILGAISDLELVDLPESSWCCGSAGIYNLTQPEMSEALLQRKLRRIEATGAEVLATANPGCHWQILNGARQRGISLRVAHPMTLLAEAYRQAKSTYAYQS